MMNSAIPFSAAIFDLDGTLLDSMYVWRAVDRKFFSERGVVCDSADYARAVQGMSFREAAIYTIERFGLNESVESVMEEWTRLSMDEYALRVPLKPGALDYLRALKRAGVKLAVATANRVELFGPALERTGAMPLFDATCTSADVGHVSKSDGALFTLAARRLGVAPADCAVFEDTLEGVQGARRAGMRAYAVRDAGSAHNREQMDALSDGTIDDFAEMARFHAIPGGGRCVIFTAHCEGGASRVYAPQPGDCVLCADGGWKLARALGVKPTLVIGDFDSSDEPEDEPTVRVPVEKDDTDTLLCLKRGLAMGYGDFLIVGGFGGRLDHTLANIQTLHYAAARSARAAMRDGSRWAAVVKDGAIRVQRNALDGGAAKLSVFALSDTCRGVTIRGAKYALEDGMLTNAFPLGVSNEFADDVAEISVREGALLVTLCRE